MAEALAIIGVVSNIASLVDFSSKLYTRLKDTLADVDEVPKSFRPIKTELPVLIQALDDIGKAFKEDKLNEETAKVVAPVVEGCKSLVRDLEKLLDALILDPKDRRSKKLWKTFKGIVKESEVNSIVVAIRGYVGTLTLYLTSFSAFKPLQEAKLTGIRRWLLAPDPTVNYQKALLERQANTGKWFLESRLYQDWIGTGSSVWLYGIPGCGKTVLSTTIIEKTQEYTAEDPEKALAYFYFDFQDQQKQGPESLVRSLIYQLSQQFRSIPIELERLYESCEDGEKQPYWNALLATLQPVLRAFSHTFIIIDALDECAQRQDLMKVIKEISRWQIEGLHLLVTSRREGDIESTLTQSLEKRSVLSIQSEAVTHDIQLYIHERLSHDDRLRKWQTDAILRQKIESSLLKNAHGMFRWAVCQLDLLRECRNRLQLHDALETLPPTLDATYDRILGTIRVSDRPYALRILRWLTFATRPLYLQEVAEIAAMDPERVSIFDRDEILEDPKDILSICSSLIVVTEEPQDQHNGSLNQDTQHVPIVQLAHYSVKEYLLSQRINKGPAAPYGLEITLCNTQIARCCLQYLLQFEDFDDLHERSLQEFALKSYSAQNWPSHLQDGLQYDQDTKYLCFELFGASKKAFKLWRRLYGCGKIYVKSTHEMENQYGASRLYFASLFGLPDVVERLLDSGKNPNADREFYGTPPLQAAACNGHVSTAHVLIKKGADVHLIGRNNASALSAALSQGLVDMARFLMDQGADINAYCGYQGFPIHAAIKGGKDAVQLLLGRGCDLFAIGQNGNALQACAMYGQPEIGKILIEHGAQINGFQGNSPRYSGTALQTASSVGNLPMVNLLLAHGADVYEQNEEGQAAIDLASNCAYIDVAERLIEHGTFSTAIAPRFNLDSALCKAIEKRNTAIAALMLKHGADPSAISLDDDDGSLVNALCAYDLPDCDLARLLLAHGANANSLSAWRQHSPFLVAIKTGNVGLVKCFIDNGADPNGQDQLIGAPLVVACQGQIDIVRLLLDHGANTFCHREFGSALAKACGEGQLETVKLLISKGASINQHDFEVIGPLHSASRYGHLDVARYLLDKGADINAMVAGLHEAVSVGNIEMTSLLLQHLAAHNAGDAYFGEALSRAVKARPLTPSTVQSEKDLFCRESKCLADVGCAEWTWTEPIDMVQFLIEKGANVNARDNRDGTALVEAVWEVIPRDYRIAELLIEQGADVNTRYDKVGTILEVALRTTKLDIARMLIEKGADVNARSLNPRGWTPMWLPALGLDVDEQGTGCGTLLEIASLRGELDIVKLLIEKGAHVEDSYGRFGSAIIAAACSAQDNPEIANVLLQSGANIDTQHPLYGNAVSAASKRGHLQVVKLLLERGASINNIIEVHDSTLRAVVQNSFREARQASNEDFCSIKGKFSSAIELLVQRGATLGSDSDMVDIVLQAAMSNDLYVMKMLIEGSTYCRVVSDEIFNVILWIASCCGQKDMIHLLFSVERNLHSQGFEVGDYERYSLALKCALSQRHLDIASFLIQKGANIHSLDSQWKSWIYIAAANGCLEVLKFLVERDADLEPAAGPYSDALVVAAANGHDAIVDFLIEKGADIDALERGWTALSAASSRGQYKLVKLLISKGANVNAATEEIGTALLAASAEGHCDIVRLLISKGANINAAHKRFGSALYVAIFRKDTDLIGLLLRRNADINIQGGKYGNALQAALVDCNYHIARRLIENGANISSQGGQFGNALQAILSASHSGCDARRNMAIFLIENGANLNAQGGEYGCALLAALSNSHYYIAELLIRKGVDVNVRAGVIDNTRLTKLMSINRNDRFHRRFEKFLIAKIAHLAIDNNAAVAALMGGFPDTAKKFLLHRETSFVVSATEYRDILILAVIHGNFALVITLLDQAEDVALPENIVTDLFLMAITWRRDALAKVLIGRGADIDARDKDGHSALHLAVLSTNPFMVKVLVENNADINAWSLEHGTVLQTAILMPSMGYGWDPEVALNLSIQFVDYLLMRGANLNYQGGRYGNALQAAIRCCIDKDEGPEYEHIPCLVDTLIVKGVDINAQGGEYGNALQAALALGKPGIAKFLIRNGADVHMRGGKHGNMVQAALSGDCRDLAEVLIRQGVNFDSNEELCEATFTALLKEYDSIVDLLLEEHKDVGLSGEVLAEALREAVLEDDIEYVKVVTRWIMRYSSHGRQRKLSDAVTAALAHGHHDIFNFLVEQGAKIDLEAFRRYADV